MGTILIIIVAGILAFTFAGGATIVLLIWFGDLLPLLVKQIAFSMRRSLS
jgi:hypothetical protein